MTLPPSPTPPAPPIRATPVGRTGRADPAIPAGSPAPAGPADAAEPADTIDPLELAATLRTAVGDLVRALRVDDVLPQNQAGVLGLLVREGPSTTSELAARRNVRQQSMARTVSLLADAGLVAQQRHATDGRKLLVTATEAGAAALLAQRARRESRIAAAITERLSPAERLHLQRTVELLHRLG